MPAWTGSDQPTKRFSFIPFGGMFQLRSPTELPGHDGVRARRGGVSHLSNRLFPPPTPHSRPKSHHHHNPYVNPKTPSPPTHKNSLVSARASDLDALMTMFALTASMAPYDCFTPPGTREYLPSGDTTATPPSRLVRGTRTWWNLLLFCCCFKSSFIQFEDNQTTTTTTNYKRGGMLIKRPRSIYAMHAERGHPRLALGRGNSTKYNIHASKKLSIIARGTGGFHGVTRRLWLCFRVNVVVESGASKRLVCWIGCVKKISLSSRLGVGHRARSAIARSTNPLVCNRRNFIFFASCWLGVSSTHQLPFPLKVGPRGLPVQCNSCRKGERFYPQHLLGRQRSGWHTHHPAFRRINTAPRSLRTPNLNNKLTCCGRRERKNLVGAGTTRKLNMAGATHQTPRSRLIRISTSHTTRRLHWVHTSTYVCIPVAQPPRLPSTSSHHHSIPPQKGVQPPSSYRM